MLLLGLMVVFALLYVFVSTTRNQVVAGDIKALHFPISGGFSKEVVEKMVQDGLSKQSVEEFVSMEDQFLYMEKETVCKGVSLKVPAMELSRQIKERFRDYDFKYHNLHIKQISEPSKAINPWLTC